jgi:CheY-like chemotaxis protein
MMPPTTNGSSSPAVPTSILRSSKKDQPAPLDDSPLQRVAFDPRVWVSEFVRDPVERRVTWYSPAEMDRFKRNAMERVCSFTELVPTGTGRLVRRPLYQKAMFSNPALLGDEDEDEFAIQRLARIELGNILVVDPHDLCARLFVKALKQMLPHATVATASSSDDALKRIRSSERRFDLIIVEERLKLLPHAEEHQVSGSAFIRMHTKESNKVPENRQPLFIGVSAHFKKDQAKLEESGAAFTWPKPPPKLDKTMRDKILKQLLLTRGKDDAALKYFH